MSFRASLRDFVSSLSQRYGSMLFIDLGTDDDSSSLSSTSTSTASSSSSLKQSPPEKKKKKTIMSEDDVVELLWKSGQIVRSSQTQRPPSVHLPILRGSGSGRGSGGEENAPLPHPPPLRSHQQPYDQNLLIPEMASWLHHHPLREDEFRSHLFYSGDVSIPFTQPQGSSLPPPPPPPPASGMYTPTAVENFINFSRLRGNIYTGGRVEAAAPWVPVVGDSAQVGSNATPSYSATDSCLTPATVTGAVSQTFALPSLSQKAIETVCEIAGQSSSGAKMEPIQIQPAAETDERKRKEREEATDETKETAEEVRGSTSRKRSRTAQMHNISERRRREKINERMKALQELIPRCNSTNKASVLEDATEYLKSLQMQILMMLMGGGRMMPMMYPPMGMMGVNRPPFIPFPGTAFPRPAPMAGLGPSYPAPRYPFPNIQAFDPSRVHLPSQQPDPLSNQPQFPGYLNTYSQQSYPVSNQPQFPGYLNPYNRFVGLQQMQQPPLQNQTTSQQSFSQASSSKEPEDQDNKPTG